MVRIMLVVQVITGTAHKALWFARCAVSYPAGTGPRKIKGIWLSRTPLVDLFNLSTGIGPTRLFSPHSTLCEKLISHAGTRVHVQELRLHVMANGYSRFSISNLNSLSFYFVLGTFAHSSVLIQMGL